MASTKARLRISAQVSVTRRRPSIRAIGSGGVEAELVGPAPVAVQEVGIDKGREYRFKLGRF
jgi:hypothetical protein